VARVFGVIIPIMIWIAGLELGAQTAPEGAIDTVLVRCVDLTGDGKPDTVSVHLKANGLTSPFSWELSIRSRGSTLCSYSGDDSAIDKNFHDEGYVPGCNDYVECKKKYYFHGILDGLEVRYNLQGILDRTRSNTLYPIGRAYLDSCCSIKGAAADAILSAMEERLRHGQAVVISIPTSPMTSEPPMMFAPEVNRFVPIYKE
jgi:hypothetical protein